MRQSEQWRINGDFTVHIMYVHKHMYHVECAIVCMSMYVCTYVRMCTSCGTNTHECTPGLHGQVRVKWTGMSEMDRYE